MKNITLFTLMMMLGTTLVFCQQNVFKQLFVGDQMPDIAFQAIRNHVKKDLRVSDLKGKVVILDFWSTGCVSCIEAFPKMEALQKQFEGKLEIILVNPHESADRVETRIRKMARYRPEYGLSTLPTVIGDTLWKVLFPHQSIPHHIWIDQQGKVSAITHGYNATVENVRTLLAGKPLNLAIKDDFALGEYNNMDDGLVKFTHPDIRPLYMSVLTRYLPGMKSGTSVRRDSVSGTYKMGYYFATVSSLLREAYYNQNGKSPFRLLDVSSKGGHIFPPKNPNLEDKWRLDNVYCYELTTPLVSKEERLQFMWDDLNRYFGSLLKIQARIEVRKIPCYVLVVKDRKKLPITDSIGALSTRVTDSTLVFNNTSYKDVFNRLEQWAYINGREAPLSDETGLVEKGVYLSLELPISNSLRKKTEEERMQALKDALSPYGIELRKKKREIKLVVVSDI